MGDFYPDLDVRIKICVTQCFIKAWLTQSFIQRICFYLHTGVWGKGRSGLFPEKRLTPVLVNVFLSASFFNPHAVVCFSVETEQDLNVKPIVANLRLGVRLLCPTCKLTWPLYKNILLNGWCFSANSRLLHIAFIYKLLSSEMKLHRLSTSGPAKQKNLKH